MPNHIFTKMKYADSGKTVWLLAERHVKTKDEYEKCEEIIDDPSVKHILLENAKFGSFWTNVFLFLFKMRDKITAYTSNLKKESSIKSSYKKNSVSSVRTETEPKCSVPKFF